VAVRCQTRQVLFSRAVLMQEDKINLRKQFQNKRALVSLVDRKQAAKQALGHLLKQVFFKESQHIACYLATPDEFDCEPIIEALWQANKACYLPVLKETQPTALDFASHNKGDHLQANRYAILEPVLSANIKKIETRQLDLVLTPLLAFDRQGHRLGMGGGYYDRSFAFRLDKTIKKPLLIGLAYALQEATSLPADPWDVNLDGVLTEQGLVIF
jgi:5-formyltetrahydrofolate cyclo-ligase